MSSAANPLEELAVNGAAPAKQHPDPPMYPGGMEIDEEEEQAVLEVLRTKRLFRYYGPLTSSSKVLELEKTFATFMGTQYSLAVTSGTAALTCALHALGIGPGDEVIVPAYTWIASAAAIITAGAIPIMAEVNEALLLDPVDVAAKITPYTKAIMAVHMRGAPCPMDELLAIARKHDLKIIEDTAQADGGSYKGKRLGSMGDAGCFSLQFNKIITAGEGGMVITNDPEVWKRSLMYHDVGGPRMYNVPTEELLIGTNYRMPELLGAVALVQLRRLDGLLTAMRERKQMLKAGMADVVKRKGITFRALNDEAGDTAIALIFFAESMDSAGAIAKALRAENIGASTLYRPDASDYHVYAHWTPIMEQRTWSPNGGPWRDAQRPIEYTKEMCPRSLDLLGRAVHLNVSPLLTNEEIEETLEGVNRVLNALA
ncbi:MAG: DegT/DnrJ/EryC1/StrS family aminotransferase [Caldilineaceae bacterium]|nr:DegT/DnrJ/EryC1/StrS family aminotransferase [Caldilineaceae bacterium]